MGIETRAELGLLMRMTIWWNEHRRQRRKPGQHRSMGLSTYEYIRMVQVGW